MLLFFLAIAALLPTSSNSIPEAAVVLSHQQQLPQASLTIGRHLLEVRLATDQRSRDFGLMKQKILNPNEGMLFVFPKAQRVSFWMKETSLPLSIAYINSAGLILEVHDLEPFNEHSIPSSSSSIVYVLEVARGWFSENQVLPGDSITGLPPASSAK